MPEPIQTSPSDAADLELMAEVERITNPFTELGSTGLKRTAGYVDEEFLPQLRGRKAVQVYREMSENDPIVGSMLFAVDNLLQNVDWNVTPAGKTRDQAKAAKLLETCRDDMSVPWKDFIGDVLTMTRYGWAWHEVVYKRREGPWSRDGSRRSLHSDGLIGWRKMPLRGQETMQRWVFNESGSVTGMVQMAPPHYQTQALPLERSLLFRTTTSRDNPEGRSMLRNAYRPWYLKKRFEEIESIGVERDLTGLPVIKMPTSWLKAKPGTEQHKMVQAMTKLVRSVRRNEQEGVIFPQEWDEETRQPIFDLSLLTSGGSRVFNVDAIIQRYQQQILMTLLADWILVGHQKVGTYNLHLDKTGLFKVALNTIVAKIADTINRYAVPRLFAINGWRPDQLPKFTPGDVDAPDISQLAQFLSATAGLGFTWGPDADLERYLRGAAGMPPLGEGDYARRQKEARVAEETRVLQQETLRLQARAEQAQAIASEQLMAEGEPDPEQAMMMQDRESASAQAEQQQGMQARQMEGQEQTQRVQNQATRVKSLMDLRSLVQGSGSGQTDSKKPRSGGS